MSLVLYHGTTSKIVKDLFNCKVNVSCGGGELGRGFYLGDSKRLAKRRAFHKTTGVLGNAQKALSMPANTLQVEIDIQLLTAHNFKFINLNRDDARGLFHSLQQNKTTGSYVTGKTDFLISPIVGRKGRYQCITQYKLESTNSQNLINKQIATLTLKTKII